MMVPSLTELKVVLRTFITEEHISWRLVFHPFRVVDILLRYRFMHFLVVGGGGAILGIGLTWLLTTFVFGLGGYFSAYLVGTAVALAFNFTMYSLVIFRTSQKHMRRLSVYFVYILGIILIQAVCVKTLTPLVGLRFYLLVIVFVIGFFSLINFLVFKLSIFKEHVQD